MNDETPNDSTAPDSDNVQDLQPSEQLAKQPSLKRKAIVGSAWALFSHGSNQILRLAGNLVLTRLLFPEAFGLMTLVQTFMAGLQMFSDIGIIPSIIQNKRGNEPAFLNTAWTIQVVRGVCLWLGACIIALPVAQFYNQPMLVSLLPVTGFGAVISGLNSTKLATANRSIALERLTILEIGSYTLGLVVMIVGAFLYKANGISDFRAVWSLVIGGLVGGFASMVGSHFFLEGEKNRFQWDKEALASLNRFGRWIFISTVFGFFGLQGDRLILGRLLDVGSLGVYSIALGLSGIATQVIDQISSKVLFPSYAELVRERPERLYQNLRKARLVLISLSVGCSMFMILFGRLVIQILYDDRYANAGWILQILAVGLMAKVLSITYGDVLMATGKTFLLAALVGCSIVIQLTSMLVGYHLGGFSGFVVGVACASWLIYCMDAIVYSRLKLWQPELDLVVVVLAIGMSCIVYFWSTIVSFI